MGERGLGIRQDGTKQGWESTDFPILCDTCLGENPYVRMTRSEFARECKTCNRPFTVFRWKPGQSSRYKKTEVCQTCAKMKNVCQTCLFDLDYGLPVELRDKFIDQKELVSMPKDSVNKNYWAQQMNQNIDKLELPYKNPEVQEALQQVAQKFNPSLKRNLPHVCSFFIKGDCNRGKQCPYRHDKITEDEIESMKKGQGSLDQKIKDRFNGINDPVAKKILSKVKETTLPQPPADLNISTLFIGGVDESIGEDDVEESFKSFGKIKSIKLIHRQNVGFVSFHARDAAEKAMECLFERLFINNKRLKVLWAKSQLESQSIIPGKGKKKNKQLKSKQQIQEFEQDDYEEEKKHEFKQYQQPQPIQEFTFQEQQISKDQLKKVAITENNQLKKLMFNYDDEDEEQVSYPTMIQNTTSRITQKETD